MPNVSQTFICWSIGRKNLFTIPDYYKGIIVVSRPRVTVDRKFYPYTTDTMVSGKVRATIMWTPVPWKRVTNKRGTGPLSPKHYSSKLTL